MMKYSFPSDARALLAGLRGRRIVMVRRQVLLSDYEELAPNIREEESDGPTELAFDEGTIIHFIPDTEQMSVRVGEGAMPAWGEHFAWIEPAANDFWAERLARPVTGICVLVSDYSGPESRSELGLELQLEGGVQLFIEYLSDESYADALRISGVQPAGSYRRLKIA